MDKQDLLLTPEQILEAWKKQKFRTKTNTLLAHTLQNKSTNIANQASLKTAKAIRDELNECFSTSQLGYFGKELDNIIKELETGVN